MSDSNVLLIVCIAVSILYIKYLVFFVLYICQLLYNICRKHRDNRIIMPLAIPGWFFNKILRGGVERFLDYNISTFPSNHFRKWLYMGLGASIEKNVVFHFETAIRAYHKLKVGKGSIIGDNAILDARSGLTLGENVNLSSNVSIYTLQHDHRDPMFRCPNNRRMDVKIEDRVWLGSNVIVLPGVTIGEGAVCCAGCVVTKDVEPYAVVAGIPARKVGERPKVLKYKFNGRACRIY